MKHSVDEKVSYNKKKKGMFSVGYVFGVSLYRDYPKGDRELKKISESIVSEAKSMAKRGDLYSKGVMCGVRDAANERKRQK